MWRIWDALDRRSRDGQIVRRPFEVLGWQRQQAMLEAAATAVHLIIAGEIPAGGTLAGALHAQHPFVYDGDPSPSGYFPHDITSLRSMFDSAVATVR